MIPLLHSLLRRRALVGRAAGISIAISCLSPPAALAQDYPVSGVWVATDDRTPGSNGGACFTLKVLGIESIFEGALPTILIFSDGRRIELRAGHHYQQSIRSVKSLADGGFRIEELPSKRSRWFPWSKGRSYSYSYSLRTVDPVTIEIDDGKRATRFVKCSAKSSLL
jgi:hypothetical protein